MTGPRAGRERPRIPGPERRQEILAALERSLATTPLLKVTVKQVAHEARCPIPTFYRHFDDISGAAAALVAAKRAEAGGSGIDDEHLAAVADLFDVEQQLPAA